MVLQSNYIVKLFFFICLISVLGSCSSYDIREDGVYFISYNEAVGKAERPIKKADVESFEIIDDGSYAKDKNYVFCESNIVQGADPSSFQLIEKGYSKDKNRAYYFGDSIASSSPKGFEIIDSYYSKDINNVFYTTEPLNVCSVKDFTFVYNDDEGNQRWTTDGSFYYFMNYKTPSEQYKSVQLYRNSAGIAKDDQYVYCLGRNIMYNDTGKQILDTVDVNSFIVTGYLDCEDKFGCINVYHGRENCD
jgi:hypothetical protein